MSLEQEQLNAIRKEADRRIIAEMLQGFSMDEMRRILIFLQQTISARGRGIVTGQLTRSSEPTPASPVYPTDSEPKHRTGFAWRRAPKLNTTPSVTTSPETTAEGLADGLDARRLALYRQLGQLSVAGLDEIEAVIKQTAAKESEGNNA